MSLEAGASLGDEVDEVGDRVDHAGRAVGEVLDLLLARRSGEDEHRAQSGLEATDDVGVHAVADHERRLGVRVEPVEGAAHHQRVGLADVVGLAARRGRDERRDRAGCRQRAGRAGAAGVGVRRDEASALLYQADCASDGLEGVGARLAEHDVVGVAVGHDVADVVHGRDEAGLADDVGAAPGALLREELRRGQRGGPDRLLRHVDPAAPQAGREVAWGEDRVVGQHEEALARGLERLDELGAPGIDVLLVDEHAVHVGEPGLDGPVIGHAPIVVGRASPRVRTRTARRWRGRRGRPSGRAG